MKPVRFVLTDESAIWVNPDRVVRFIGFPSSPGVTRIHFGHEDTAIVRGTAEEVAAALAAEAESPDRNDARATLAALDKWPCVVDAPGPAPGEEPMPDIIWIPGPIGATAGGEWRGVKWSVVADAYRGSSIGMTMNCAETLGGIPVHVADVTVRRNVDGADLLHTAQRVATDLLRGALRRATEGT